MSIELTTADVQKRRGIGQLLGFPKVIAEIPESLEPGERVFVTETGSEWIGADPDNGIFPELDAGRPWPLKGYKEAMFLVGFDKEAPEGTLFEISNDGGVSINQTGESLEDIEIEPESGVGDITRFSVWINSLNKYDVEYEIESDRIDVQLEAKVTNIGFMECVVVKTYPVEADINLYDFASIEE